MKKAGKNSNTNQTIKDERSKIEYYVTTEKDGKNYLRYLAEDIIYNAHSQFTDDMAISEAKKSGVVCDEEQTLETGYMLLAENACAVLLDNYDMEKISIEAVRTC